MSGTLAARLIERFGSVKGVCLCSQDQLLEVRGIGAGTAEKIMAGLGMVDEA